MDILIGYYVNIVDLIFWKVNKCCYSPNGLFILFASNDNTLKVWDSRTGDCVISLKQNDCVRCCAISPDGTRIVAGVGDDLIVLDSTSLNFGIDQTSFVDLRTTI